MARKFTVAYKDERPAHIASLLTPVGTLYPDTVAGRIALLLEGAIASMLVRQDPAVAIQARGATTGLMQSGLPTSGAAWTHTLA